MRKNYQSEILGVLHGMAEDLHEIGAISDAEMLEYDHDCLIQKPSQISKTENSRSRPARPVFAERKS